MHLAVSFGENLISAGRETCMHTRASILWKKGHAPFFWTVVYPNHTWQQYLNRNHLCYIIHPSSLEIILSALAAVYAWLHSSTRSKATRCSYGVYCTPRRRPRILLYSYYVWHMWQQSSCSSFLARASNQSLYYWLSTIRKINLY